MRVIKKKTLAEFTALHPDAAASVSNWCSQVEAASWRSMSDIVRSMGHAPSPVGTDRVVFNLANNKYRLVCAVKLSAGIVYVKFIGTHREYDGIDPATVPFKA